jgi:outer membrane receptor for monomeric catechols
MSDEVRQAAFIGAAINRGLGAIPTGKKKKLKDKKDKKDKNTTQTESTSTKTDETKDSPKVSKPALETPTEPTFVKSERINKEVQNSSPKAIGYNPSEPKPNIGKQFTGYTGMYGTDNQPPIDLSKF